MKKSFILLTFLTPILLAAMFVVPLWLSGIQDENIKNIIVIDKTGLYHDVFKSSENYTFVFTDKPIENYRNEKDKKNELSAVLYIASDLSQNPKGATLYSEKQVNMELKEFVSNQLSEYVQQQKLAALGIPDMNKIMEQSKTDIKIETIKWDKEGNEEKTSAELALVIGTVAAVLIYMFIMVYGAQVMSGVVQEKVNRIVEVMISSVKPFELMMGKIIGIALVGLTQFFLWILLTFIIYTAVISFVNVDNKDLAKMNSMDSITSVQTSESSPEKMVENADFTDVLEKIQGVNFLELISLFIIYFLGGYLLYASLFAAIGSAVDNETDTQQFSMPLTLPIFFAVYAAIYSAQNPDGPLAFWCSMIPFTSPIVMMVRLPFDVPAWQIVLSVSILILSFVGTTWLAGKVYRTGILMYGKKPTWKEMWKWVRYS